jgi:hypothetical protein
LAKACRQKIAAQAAESITYLIFSVFSISYKPIENIFQCGTKIALINLVFPTV